MKEEFNMQFGFIEFNHTSLINKRQHEVEVYYKNGATHKFQYAFSVQVLFRLIAENIKLVFGYKPLP